MLTVLVGDYNKCIKHLKTIDNNPTYVHNIKEWFKVNSGFLAKNNNTVYFLYDDSLKDKEAVSSFVRTSLAKKNNVVSIVETIDKKSSFYKQCKPYIKEFKMVDNSITVNDILKNPVLLYDCDNVVSMLYKLYYNYKFKNDIYRMKITSSCINYILAGNMVNVNSIQYYILNI